MLFVKAKSLARALWSFIRWGDAALDLHDKRASACYLCDELRVVPRGVFCRACKCPRWALSDLRTKWRMRDARCPLNKW